VTARRPKLQQFTFAEMKAALAGAKVGDTVRVSVDKRVEPTSYVVTYVNGDSLLVNGGRGSQRCLTYTQAEGVWLRKGPRGRRVVQAWVERDSTMAAAFSNLEKLEATITKARYDENLAVLADIAKELGYPGQEREPGYIRSLVLTAIRSAHHDNSALKVVTKANVELELAHAELGRQLERVERDRDECRLALAQIRNVANGVVPGTSLLPSNTAPSLVVIEVTAALHRAVSSETRRPISVAPEFGYRETIAGALPPRMREPKHAAASDGATPQ
jgi:hypothetical protein